MKILIGLAVLGAIGLGVWAWRRQADQHRVLSEAVSAQLGDARYQDPRALYYGLASRGALQPHELLAVVVASDTVLRVEVPAVGAMAPISLTVPMDTVEALLYTHRFVAMGPGARAGGAGLQVVRFLSPDGESEAVALRVGDPDAFARVLEAGTGRSFQQKD